MSKRNSLILVVVVALATVPAFASGFGFYENGAKASGQGGAWVARADDAAANWYNPAALVHLSGMEVQFGMNYLDVGSDTHFESTTFGNYDAVGNVATPAHFYFAQRINDKVAWGVGLNNPFGLVSEWKDLPVTLSSRRAELNTYLLNPNLAIRLSPKWSFALGADYLSAEVRDFSRDVFVDSVLGVPVTTANLTGEGDAWGYNFALQFKTESFAVGGQYRSSMRPHIQGNVTFSGIPALNSSASANLDLPGQTMLGAAWTGKRVDIELGGYYTQWNYFKSLDVNTGNPATSASLTENWKGTWSGRLGVAVRLDKESKHELRFGGVYDQSPIPTDYLRPSIPDATRTEGSIGYGYLSKRWGIDVYAMNIWFDDVTSTGSPSDGVFPGATYKSSILLAGVTAKFRF